MEGLKKTKAISNQQLLVFNDLSALLYVHILNKTKKRYYLKEVCLESFDLYFFHNSNPCETHDKLAKIFSISVLILPRYLNV